LGLFLFLLILIFSNNKRITQVITLSLGGVLALSALLYEPMRQKLFITTSFFSRLSLWQHAWELFEQNLFWGVGLNHFQYTFPVDVLPEAGATYFDAHSLYFQTASQMGIAGLVAIAMVGFGFLNHWLRLRELNPLQNSLKYAALGGFCVIFIGGFFDTTLHHGQAIAFAFLTGLLFGYSSQGRKQE
jgi:O-antigen ligase